jgi:uncharacterized DUF497 family protein
MKFIWNKVKRQSNLKKHAIDFVNAEKVGVAQMKDESRKGGNRFVLEIMN